MSIRRNESLLTKKILVPIALLLFTASREIDALEPPVEKAPVEQTQLNQLSTAKRQGALLIIETDKKQYTFSDEMPTSDQTMKYTLIDHHVINDKRTNYLIHRKSRKPSRYILISSFSGESAEFDALPLLSPNKIWYVVESPHSDGIVPSAGIKVVSAKDFSTGLKIEPRQSGSERIEPTSAKWTDKGQLLYFENNFPFLCEYIDGKWTAPIAAR